jgi:hypothetical protein
MAGSLGKILFLLSRMSPSLEGAHEPLRAQLTLGIDPRRTDSGVGGRLVQARPTSSVDRSSGRAATREPSCV